MVTYCKHCRRNHAAWTRLNDGVICGRCGTRNRDQRIVPLKTLRTSVQAHRLQPLT